MVDGEIIKVRSVIHDQYTLKKLWENIKDMMYEKPIRYAKEVNLRSYFRGRILKKFCKMTQNFKMPSSS